mmetsp:Transcript_34143/g.66490  ORF Transcript_34143/g.66490 Transcript_34143/m.66490 type:complete len:91 (-) Transcript_34143:1203-1475(-)
MMLAWALADAKSSGHIKASLHPSLAVRGADSIVTSVMLTWKMFMVANAYVFWLNTHVPYSLKKPMTIWNPSSSTSTRISQMTIHSSLVAC